MTRLVIVPDSPEPKLDPEERHRRLMAHIRAPRPARSEEAISADQSGEASTEE